MPYITKSQLRAIGSSSTARVNETIYRKSAASKETATVFLSHSHEDKDTVEAAIRLLSSQGVTVYVDWLDPGMPSITSTETAARLKKRIREQERFVLLASVKALESRWVPWELGIADGVREMSEIAVLPFKDSYTDWTRSEYLGLYPWIEPSSPQAATTYGAAAPLNAFVVRFPDGRTSKSLGDWLKTGGNAPIRRF